MVSDIAESQRTRTPEELRNALVDLLIRWRVLEQPRVAEAMRTVPRHLFVPEVSLESAYADHPVITKRRSDGTSSSSASQPAEVARQLQQLDLQPGHRVLEIGAGTGYNAALLAELVGPGGEVTTIDVDPEVAARAKHALDNSGYERVQVFAADGEFGHPPHAPYDRVIATIGAWDIPPAWAQQLAPAGRLVVPLRLPGHQMTIAFDPHGDHYSSVAIATSGFMPIQGAGSSSFRTVPIADDAFVLRFDDDRDLPNPELEGTLQYPRHEAWTGAVVGDGTSWDHLYLWLTLTEPSMCTFTTSRAAIDQGLTTPILGWGGTAFYDDHNIAYLTNRRASGYRQHDLFELGIIGHGPHSQDLANQLAEQIRTWNQQARGTTTPHIDVYPTGTDAPPDDEIFIIDKQHTQIAISFTTT